MPLILIQVKHKGTRVIKSLTLTLDNASVVLLSLIKGREAAHYQPSTARGIHCNNS